MSSNTNTESNKADEKATPAKSSNATLKTTPHPDDKLYCICAQKASGKMIACDNDVSTFLFLPLSPTIQTNLFLQ